MMTTAMGLYKNIVQGQPGRAISVNPSRQENDIKDDDPATTGVTDSDPQGKPVFSIQSPKKSG